MGKETSLGKRIVFILNLLLWMAFLVVLGIACSPLTLYMLKPLTVEEDIHKADVIVVLTGGINKGRYLSLESSHRLVRGAQIYFEGSSRKILFSGGIHEPTGVAEAMVMAQEARRLNIPAEDMILEKQSRNLFEQSIEVKKITEPLHWKSLILVTSCRSMKRSIMVFEHAGFKVYPAPADPYERYVENPLGRLWLFQQLIREYGGIIYDQIIGWA